MKEIKVYMLVKKEKVEVNIRVWLPILMGVVALLVEIPCSAF